MYHFKLLHILFHELFMEFWSQWIIDESIEFFLWLRASTVLEYHIIIPTPFYLEKKNMILLHYSDTVVDLSYFLSDYPILLILWTQKFVSMSGWMNVC